MKTLSSYFLTNYQYTRYFCQKNNIDQIEVEDTNLTSQINTMCNTYDIDFTPYLFTLKYESPENIKSFANFFTTMLHKTDMCDYSLSTESSFDKVIEVMSVDIDYLLAGIACIQYFFL